MRALASGSVKSFMTNIAPRRLCNSRTGVCTIRSCLPADGSFSPLSLGFAELLIQRSAKALGIDCAPRHSTVGSSFAYNQLLVHPIQILRVSPFGMSLNELVA